MRYLEGVPSSKEHLEGSSGLGVSIHEWPGQWQLRREFTKAWLPRAQSALATPDTKPVECRVRGPPTLPCERSSLWSTKCRAEPSSQESRDVSLYIYPFTHTAARVRVVAGKDGVQRP
jgi:hypothetical protein